MEKVSSDLLKTKHHFEVLDGLRGIAAIGVVVFHFMEWIITDYSKNFIGHGYLAVDFFFCLSGFVMAYAYDDRMGKMDVLEFFKSRLIRLHPLVVLGAVLGLISTLYDPFGYQTVVYNTGRLFLVFVCTVFLIPFPVMQERGFNLFGLNAPSWSLFWEYIANIIYAYILYKITRRYLIVLTIIAAVPICIVSYRAGNLMGGWGGANFWDGCARLTYSFLAGLFVYRSGWIIKNKLGFIVLAVLLSFALLMPYPKWNWLLESMVVIFYFPLLIALGAGASVSPVLKKLCDYLGRLSYPLYMTHYVGVWVFANYFLKHKPAMSELAYVIPLATILLIIFAALVLKYFDIPLRQYLNKKRQQVLVDSKQK